jgi:hypothetical protein
MVSGTGTDAAAAAVAWSGPNRTFDAVFDDVTSEPRIPIKWADAR